MYAPLSPILAADSPDDGDTQQVLIRIEGLAAVLATVSRLAGQATRPFFDALARHADLSAVLASATPDAIGLAARELDTLGLQLQAGLLALEKSRAAARLNRGAAALLHAESAESYRAILAGLGYRTSH